MSNDRPLPDHYVAVTRVVIKFATVMTALSLLSGISYQESAKKIAPGALDPGLHLAAIRPLALVHGHMMVTGVLVPIAMVGLLFLARAIGGRDVKPIVTKMLTRGYLPFMTASLLLLLYKGYHVLLMVRFGEHDLAAIDAAFFGGVKAARYGVYGVAHTVMAVALGLFLIALWKSLKPRKTDA